MKSLKRSSLFLMRETSSLTEGTLIFQILHEEQKCLKARVCCMWEPVCLVVKKVPCWALRSCLGALLQHGKVSGRSFKPSPQRSTGLHVAIGSEKRDLAISSKWFTTELNMATCSLFAKSMTS